MLWNAIRGALPTFTPAESNNNHTAAGHGPNEQIPPWHQRAVMTR